MKPELIIVFSENRQIVSRLRDEGLKNIISVVDSDNYCTDALRQLKIPSFNNFNTEVLIPVGSPKHIFEIRDFELNSLALKFKIKIIIDSSRGAVLMPLYYILKNLVDCSNDFMIADSCAAQKLISVIELAEFDGIAKSFKKNIFHGISVCHL